MRTGRRVKNRIADDRGISLVELIVVISIMVVLTGVVSMGLGMMFSRDANYVAVRIDDTLTEARTMSMSREGDVTYTLHIDSDPAGNYTGSYVEIKRVDKDGNVLDDDRTALDKSVTITATGATPDGSGNIVIVFNKAKGNVETVNGSAAASGIVYTFDVVSRRNASSTRTVTLVPTTGRHYTDK